MKLFRIFYKLIAVILWFVLMTFYAGYFHIIYRLKGRRRQDLIRRLSYAEKAWSKGLASISGLHIKVFGSIEGIDGMLVSNHLSYMDILTLGSVFPIRFTPKKEISNWPFLGWFIRISCPIWIDRSSRNDSKKLMKEFAETINNGTRLVIFPEGTTTDGKGELLPFKSAVFGVAVTENIRLCPILIRYKEEDIEVPWYGDATLFGHLVKVLGLRKIEAEVYILNVIEAIGKSRKELSREIYKYMNQEYLKIYKKRW